MNAEGWYHDPYELHEERWFSDGTATRLVRDGRVESNDPPPDTPPSSPLVRSEGHPLAGGDDLRRADDAERGGNDPDYGDRAFETFGIAQTGWEPYGQPDESR